MTRQPTKLALVALPFTALALMAGGCAQEPSTAAADLNTGEEFVEDGEVVPEGKADDFLSATAREFVLAARTAGLGPWGITRDHILPNIASLLIVQATISFATAILAEAALSYLGLGTQPPQPSWGRMLNEAQAQMFQAPLLAVYPGVAIVLSVLGLNLLGDGLRDLLDPKLARQR